MVDPPLERATMKSTVSDFLGLLYFVYIDACSRCSADVTDLRDLETVRSRVEFEGQSFLTITLPAFSRDFEQSLEIGRIDSTFFRGFKRVKNEAIPAFLQGMLSHVFDRVTGVKIHDCSTFSRDMSCDCPSIVESVRQICLLFKKVDFACTPQRVQASLDNFIKIEQELGEFSVQEQDRHDFREVSAMLWGNMFGDYSPDNLLPKHGPGQTSERISGNQKFVWRRWHDRLEPYFPLIATAYPLGTPPESEVLQSVTIVPEEEEQPVRVVVVPKTQKAPRVIAIEPVCMQYTQQAIRAYLYDKLESHKLTSGHINFVDQSVNQRHAMNSSSTRRLATIDLSDASDRVPLELALGMFDCNPDLRDSINACRSTRAVLPDGTLVSPLRKFASMGSALCFPIEAMYFYTICVVALMRAKGYSRSFRNLYKVTRELYVYGDDLVVPSAYADVVLDHLSKYNCKVNPNKTFVSGNFRESCGVDAYAGVEVTPIYIHTARPENKRTSQEVMSWLASRNLFYKKGYWMTTTFMQLMLERAVRNIPYLSDTSPGLGYTSFLGYESIDRWNRDLQRPEVRALVPETSHRSDEIDGYSAMTKCFLDLERADLSRPRSQKRSLTHSALRGAVTLKRRGVAPH